MNRNLAFVAAALAFETKHGTHVGDIDRKRMNAVQGRAQLGQQFGGAGAGAQDQPLVDRQPQQF